MRSNSFSYSSPQFGEACMPASSSLAPLALIFPIILSRLARTVAGSMPRSMSLAPSSRITRSGLSASDQSSRASPPAVVSPELPALMTCASIPSARRRFSSCAGKLCSGGRPNPAVRLSPNARIFDVRAARRGPPLQPQRTASSRTSDGESGRSERHCRLAVRRIGVLALIPPPVSRSRISPATSREV